MVETKWIAKRAILRLDIVIKIVCLDSQTMDIVCQNFYHGLLVMYYYYLSFT